MFISHSFSVNAKYDERMQTVNVDMGVEHKFSFMFFQVAWAFAFLMAKMTFLIKAQVSIYSISYLTTYVIHFCEIIILCSAEFMYLNVQLRVNLPGWNLIFKGVICYICYNFSRCSEIFFSSAIIFIIPATFLFLNTNVTAKRIVTSWYNCC